MFMLHIENTLISQLQNSSVYKSSLEEQKTNNNEFSKLLIKAIDNVNELHQKAGKATKEFELGTTDISLAEVMIARSKAGVATEATIQVRNKAIEGYKEIMNMAL
ncbi:MAG: flagellar hook-basal body complex protein FliE [Flavobacteriaceae bacterium]|nr:flagellar hook-basal body complex protein FliE [Flavobacteriaceae bacterium]